MSKLVCFFSIVALAAFAFIWQPSGVTELDSAQASSIFGAVHDGCHDGHSHLSGTKGCGTGGWCPSQPNRYVHGFGVGTAATGIQCPCSLILCCGTYNTAVTACATVSTGLNP